MLKKMKIIDGQPISVSERVCSNCKGVFDATPDWQYKHLNAFCCSYSCMQSVRRRAEEKKLAERAARRKTKKPTLPDTMVVGNGKQEGITPEQEEAVIENAKRIREELKKEEVMMEDMPTLQERFHEKLQELQEKTEAMQADIVKTEPEIVEAVPLPPDPEQNVVLLLKRGEVDMIEKLVERSLLEQFSASLGIDWIMNMTDLIRTLRRAVECRD